MIGAAPATLAAILPQGSEHRRYTFRDWLRHREPMMRLKREPLQRTRTG